MLALLVQETPMLGDKRTKGSGATAEMTDLTTMRKVLVRTQAVSLLTLEASWLAHLELEARLLWEETNNLDRRGRALKGALITNENTTRMNIEVNLNSIRIN